MLYVFPGWSIAGIKQFILCFIHVRRMIEVIVEEPVLCVFRNANLLLSRTVDSDEVVAGACAVEDTRRLTTDISKCTMKIMSIPIANTVERIFECVICGDAVRFPFLLSFSKVRTLYRPFAEFKYIYYFIHVEMTHVYIPDTYGATLLMVVLSLSWTLNRHVWSNFVKQRHCFVILLDIICC